MESPNLPQDEDVTAFLLLLTSSDQTEVNYDLQYVMQKGVLEGVSVRLRYADVERQSYTSNTQTRLTGLDEEQFRVIINYEIQL